MSLSRCLHSVGFLDHSCMIFGNAIDFQYRMKFSLGEE
ncbi:hypothetical protein BRADI_2g50142v3 [Brachypodium distachyon]|uniref:Uncharacterized protein n=1 Tax=Brachypodium distachyon TaxID=15368 RepID=A0A2K2DEZ3_BRADI|nr:hypothetical protein BRADI_2g50142v3 [Brachypodium distachyon]